MREENQIRSDLGGEAQDHPIPSKRHRGEARVKKRKLPRGVYWRGGVLWIRYKGAEGKIVRETTRQTSIEFAKKRLAQRQTEMAEGRAFPTKVFERVTFGELLDAWWARVPEKEE
jgi:hypothetical protein